MNGDNSKQSSSFSAVFCFFFSLALPVVGFCLLRTADWGRDARLAWSIWTFLATVVLPLWHLWLHFWRAEGSLAIRFRSVIATSGRRIWALFVFILPLLMVVADQADSYTAQVCGFLWLVSLLCLCSFVRSFLLGVFDNVERQKVDLTPLMRNHYSRGTIS